MKPSTRGAKALAEIFGVIAEATTQTETQADAILNLVRQQDHDEKSFSAAVREAYRQRGWNLGRGRPAAGVELARVPATVKQYISTVRKAFKFRLRVESFKTFHELRKGVKTRRHVDAEKTADPVLAGVKLDKPKSLTGGPFHDLIAAYTVVDDAAKRRMVRKVNEMVQELIAAKKLNGLDNDAPHEQRHLRIAA